MTPEQKQKLISQAQQIEKKGCDAIAQCEKCVLNNHCDGDFMASNIYARLFLAGIDFEKDQQPVKNPCIDCGKEWNNSKTDACPHCGNVVPF